MATHSGKASFVVLIILLLCSSATAAASIRKTVIKDAPFFPYVNLSYLGLQSNLANQQRVVKKGESAEILSWDRNYNFFKVKLQDGSLGYIPAFFFIKNGIKHEFERGFRCCEADIYKNSLGNGNYKQDLAPGTYTVTDIQEWTPKYGPNAKKLVVVASKSRKQFIVDIAGKDYNSLGFNFQSILSTSDFKKISADEHVSSKPLFIDTEDLGYTSLYKGISETKLSYFLGQPDAIIAAGRSKYNKKELLYQNVCYPDKNNSKYVSCGVVFYITADGKVEDVKEDAYLTRPNKNLNAVAPPLPEGVAAPRGQIKLPGSQEGVFVHVMSIIIFSAFGIVILAVFICLFWGLRSRLIEAGSKKKKKNQTRVTFIEDSSGSIVSYVGVFLASGDFKTNTGTVFSKQPNNMYRTRSLASGDGLLFSIVRKESV